MEKKNISRRSFLKLFGAGSVATAATLAGCKGGNKAASQATEEYKNQLEPPVGQMTYRENPKTKEKVSILGYGMMRLPTKVDNSDEYDQDMIINSNRALEEIGNNAVLVIVDVNKPKMTECEELIKKAKSIVVLDHHRQGAEFVENATLSYVEPYASSACEMVSEIMQYTTDAIKIRNEEADCLYSGIMIDTNNFNQKTGVKTFEAAAFLKRNGADVVRVRKMFREDAIEYKTRADCVSDAEIYREFYAISVCGTDGIASPTVIGAQAANELLNIKGIKASFVLTDFQGTIYISARSIDELNVQVVMERMGGGGHMSIAGTQVENSTVEEVIANLKSTLDSMIEGGEI